MDNLQRLLLEARQKEEQDKKIEVLVRILSALYDKAVAYTNLVIIAGYAAFFTVWSIMKDQLSQREMLVSAFCITFSLIFFVFWETLKMIITSTYFTGLHRVLEGPPEQNESNGVKSPLDPSLEELSYHLWTARAIFPRFSSSSWVLPIAPLVADNSNGDLDKVLGNG